MDHYLRTARVAWGMLLFFVVILFLVVATAQSSQLSGVLKGGLLAIASFMLLCVIAIAGKTLMADKDTLFAAPAAHEDGDGLPGA